MLNITYTDLEKIPFKYCPYGSKDQSSNDRPLFFTECHIVVWNMHDNVFLSLAANISRMG